MYIHIYMYVCVFYVYVYEYAYMHVQMYVNVCIYAYLHAWMHVYILRWSADLDIQTSRSKHLYPNIYIQTSISKHLDLDIKICRPSNMSTQNWLSCCGTCLVSKKKKANKRQALLCNESRQLHWLVKENVAQQRTHIKNTTKNKITQTQVRPEDENEKT